MSLIKQKNSWRNSCSHKKSRRPHADSVLCFSIYLYDQHKPMIWWRKSSGTHSNVHRRIINSQWQSRSLWECLRCYVGVICASILRAQQITRVNIEKSFRLLMEPVCQWLSIHCRNMFELNLECNKAGEISILVSVHFSKKCYWKHRKLSCVFGSHYH